MVGNQNDNAINYQQKKAKCYDCDGEGENDQYRPYDQVKQRQDYGNDEGSNGRGYYNPGQYVSYNQNRYRTDNYTDKHSDVVFEGKNDFGIKIFYLFFLPDRYWAESDLLESCSICLGRCVNKSSDYIEKFANFGTS